MGRKDNSRYTHRPSPTKVTAAPSDARTHPNTYRGQPNVPHSPGGYEGKVVCTRCHAIWDHKHWHLDASEFECLQHDPQVGQVVCPSCAQIERGEYDGYVVLKSALIPANQESILGLIYHTEERLRETNPLARIAGLTIKGETIEVLTITPFLAERIGKELLKAYDGELEIKHLDRAKFMRVTWDR